MSGFSANLITSHLSVHNDPAARRAKSPFAFLITRFFKKKKKKKTGLSV